MSLLKTVVSEMSGASKGSTDSDKVNTISESAAGGSTGAGAVAAYPGSLFGGGILQEKSKKKRKMIRRLSKGMSRLGEALGIQSDKSQFNAADVVSKLDAAQKKAKVEDDTTTFGLEDDKGNMIKVHVRADQAEEFERALSSMLGGADDNADDKNSSLEIAEVLYNLKNKFEIVDVDWGSIQSDEEEEQEVDPGQEGAEGQPGQEGMPGQEGEMPPPGGEMGGGDEDVKSLLTQVVDVLKSQAEAQKAEADARTAEAKAKEAEFAAKSAESKIKQEEETLDMETYYKDKSEQKKEAQRLVKLAKFKHDKARDADSLLQGGDASKAAPDTDLGGEESEERSVVSPRELAAAIFRQLKK